MTTTIVIADDHEIVRIGLKVTLEAAGMRVLADVADGVAAFEAVKWQRPNVALLNVRMPGGDGISCLSRIKHDVPETQVLMLSGNENPTYLARAVALGAGGYLLKSVGAEQVVEAVRAVAAGKSIWPPDIVKRMSAAFAGSAGGTHIGAQFNLTRREGDVLQLMAHGLTNKEIAKSLGIGYDTVKEHVQHVLRKLGVSDRTQAAVWAVRHQIV